MKYGLIGLAAVAISTAAVFMHKEKPVNTMSQNIPASSAGSFEPVAVLELFTSQGCSSCPPADRLLARTINSAGDKKIFALSFHVDYWNRLGWPDPFSSEKFTDRQGSYVSSMNLSGSYTPQMVVNGSTEFVGSESGELSHAIARSLSQKAEAEFSTLKITSAVGSPVQLQYALNGNYAGKTVNFALVSLHESTDVKRGENGGAVLKNDNVVRQLITQQASASGSASFASAPMPAQGNMAVIGFVQDGNAGKIVGAAMASIN